MDRFAHRSTPEDITADVVIAGGGIAGLSCAAWLAADCGLRVVLVEKDNQLGGRAASWLDPTTGDAVDIGPHVITSEHRNFLALLERLGTAGQLQWQPDPLITLLDGGRQLRMHAPRWPPPLHGLPNLPNALRCMSWRDLMSNMSVAWTAARLDERQTLALDDLDAESYLRLHGVSGRSIDWFWRSSMLALLNVPLAECSAAAVMRVFRLMLGRSGYCFGFPKVALADLFAPGCRRAVEAGGGQVHTSCAARSLLATAGGAFEGMLLEDGRIVRARAGVLALPPQALAALAGDAAGAASDCFANGALFKPCAYVSTMLWFDDKLTPERFWARVWAEGDLNTDFYDLSNIRPQRPRTGSLIAANAIHADEAWTWSDARLVAQTRRELAEFAPAAAGALLRHSRVHRIPMAVPCPAPGTERLRPAASTAVQGLWLAGDWTATGLPCSMESAARSGALAAEHVAAAFGRGLRHALPAPSVQWPIAALTHSGSRR
ncbi:hydroxysqualene dehydroxylase [Variovorax paradoxus]|uniref:Amine oxidase n=1 Tax=Variovorax paradoxus (strain EPS) TaxID=595537 RepID=E6V3W0_VARPE|nr:FAD-dependent oxidoreductase [Variovorax paradoxus]ADU36984.1 amine oxidase [Variovorax paradoxus EPS]